MELLAKQLATAMPTLRAPRVWLSVLNEAMERFEIDSPPHIAAFLVQVAHASKECRYLEDDLRYPAEALMRMWPQHFPSLATAHPYERNPEKLANFVYSNRLGNGPPESCDGYRYRGRGLIRIIGRASYASAGAALEVDLERQPETLLEPRNAAMSAAWIWRTRAFSERRVARVTTDCQARGAGLRPLSIFGAVLPAPRRNTIDPGADPCADPASSSLSTANGR
jgi:putative chitinase